jgi:hypothetical protein
MFMYGTWKLRKLLTTAAGETYCGGRNMAANGNQASIRTRIILPAMTGPNIQCALRTCIIFKIERSTLVQIVI